MARRKPDPNEPPLPKASAENFREAIKIFKYMGPYTTHLIGGLILLALSSMVFMVFPYLGGQMVDIAQGKSELDMNLADVGWILVLILVVQGVISYSRVILFAIVSEKGIANVRKEVFRRLIGLPLEFYENNKSGELISRITADIEKLYSTFSITLAEFIRQVIILIAGVIFLAFTTPRLAGVMLLTFPVIVVGALIFGRFIRKLSKKRQEKLAVTNTILGEAIQSIVAVKTFTNEWLEWQKYGDSIQDTVKVSLRYARGRAIFAVFIITVLFGSLFFIIWQGARMLENGTVTAGELISFVIYTGIIGGAIAGLGNFYTEILGAIGATERVREILNENIEVNITENPPILSFPLTGAIEFKDVRFSYPTRPDIPVLKGLDMTVRPGEKVALVGPSGVGKSTIVQLLLQLYPEYGGQILVDGHDVAELDVRAFRQHLAIVPQEVLLFGGTIRENILYGKLDATDDEIIAAAEQANAWSFIQQFPEGLDTMVGERGVKLSGGQRQRVAIARAILKDPAILLLDEATSALDAESERVVQEALETLMEGRTSIIIAHRLATIKEVDRIFVIDNGVIVESGTHEELSQLENGLYNGLAQLQFADA